MYHSIQENIHYCRGTVQVILKMPFLKAIVWGHTNILSNLWNCFKVAYFDSNSAGFKTQEFFQPLPGDTRDYTYNHLHVKWVSYFWAMVSYNSYAVTLCNLKVTLNSMFTILWHEKRLGVDGLDTEQMTDQGSSQTNNLTNRQAIKPVSGWVGFTLSNWWRILARFRSYMGPRKTLFVPYVTDLCWAVVVLKDSREIQQIPPAS